MPKLKLKAKAVEQKSGFEPYDGPEPTRRGFYRSAIKKFQYGKKNSGSYGFFIVLELEAAKGDPKDHAKFDGYPMFSRNIITESSDGAALKEGAQRNLSNLLAALGTGDDPDVILAKDGDPDSGMVDVLKIGGKNPVGAIINVDMDFETYQDEKRPSVGGIYKFKEEAGPSKASPKFEEDEDEDEDEDDEADLMDSDEEASEVDERAAELDEMKTVELRKIAKELGVKSSGTKEVVIEAILDAEFPSDDDEAEDESEEESDDEDEVEEVEDDEEAEEDEEEEDESDEESERLEELQSFDRVALKKILKEIAKDFTVLKRHSDDDLREAIINVEFGEDTPF